MEISSLYPNAMPQRPSVKGQSSDQQFLGLLLAQLSAQNPLEPLQDADFMNQVSQFSQMEQFQSLNNNLIGLASMQAELTGLSQLSQAGALVGKEAEFERADGTLQRGVIERLRIDSGRLIFDVGGEEFGFDQLRSVMASSQDDGSQNANEGA